MRLIIELEEKDIIKDIRSYNVASLKELYENVYKKHGFLYEEDHSAIYYEVDIPFMPYEGQRIGTRFGCSIVTYAFYQLEENINGHYYQRSKITVTEE